MPRWWCRPDSKLFSANLPSIARRYAQNTVWRLPAITTWCPIGIMFSIAFGTQLKMLLYLCVISQWQHASELKYCPG